MKFTYTAVTKDGKTVHGTLDAVDRQGVVSSLTKQGAKPVAIKAEGVHGSKKHRGKKVKSKDLVIFTRQLSTMISAGVPLTTNTSKKLLAP